VTQTYEDWADILPVEARGRNDDPGDFGIPNLLRYAFGMDPLRPTRENLPQLGRTGINNSPGGESLTLTFTRRKDARDLVFSVEASQDLQVWNLLNVPIETIDDGNGETETVKVTDNVALNASATRFLRLRIESQ